MGSNVRRTGSRSHYSDEREGQDRDEEESRRGSALIGHRFQNRGGGELESPKHGKCIKRPGTFSTTKALAVFLNMVAAISEFY